MDSAEIRRRFLKFFEDRDHHVVPSSSLLLDDPTLLFVNAGMVPFKPYFLGEATPPYPRLTSVQKCLRTLDIEDVGKDTRHASFFQMCGNFALGDYFKEKAIPYAWELLTSSVEAGGYGLDPDRLWITVYLDDDEAADIWHHQVGVPRERIQRMGMTDNYWSMGVPGPCGPDSEIFYDRGEEYGAEGGPAVDDSRYIEVWNLVFMQNLRGGGGEHKEGFEIVGELPHKNIDTGMGLERLACILQGVDNIYEIDTTRVILQRATGLTGIHYGADHESDVRLRVVADHTRACAFIIGDGVTPGNDGRGYVLRRLLRRVIRNMRLLGADGTEHSDRVIGALVDAAIEAMGPQYPELVTDAARIRAVAEAEEVAFLQTLTKGTALFDTAVAGLRETGARTLPGASAFALHDTYGFPIDLTLEMAAEAGVEVDEEGFRALMREQRARARQDAQSRKAGLADNAVYRELFERTGATDWLAYEGLDTEARVIALLQDVATVPALSEGEVGTVVLDRTTFYAESGGQHADAGVLVGEGVEVEVLDVQRPVKGLVAHQVRVTKGELVSGMGVEARVDPLWRRQARQAHSGTHVVHAALREVLGPDALQAGSFNRPGYLRLDFSWSRSLARAQRSDIEAVSNRAVRDDLPVRVDYMTLPEAKAAGALALFGETYGDTVRVVEIGGPWSRELCGGTHVSASSQIGPLAVTGESSVGSGVRRIEAVVGLPAYDYLARERDLVDQLAELVKARPEELAERVESMMTRLKDAERELARLRSSQLTANIAGIIGAGAEVGPARVWTFQAPEGVDAAALRELVTKGRSFVGADVAALLVGATVADGKVSMVAATNEAGRARGLSAAAALKAALPAVGGRGGGKDDMAQGGGADPHGVPAALAAAVRAVQESVSG
jgi:alanyl-tRNA synthetase